MPCLHPHPSYGYLEEFGLAALVSVPLTASGARCKAGSAHKNLLGHCSQKTNSRYRYSYVDIASQNIPDTKVRASSVPGCFSF